MIHIQKDNSNKIISINCFDSCLICGISKKQIKNEFPTRKDGAYYLNKFENHLIKYHETSLKEFLKQKLQQDYPKCPISHEYVNFKVTGKGIIFNKFKKGSVNQEHCEAFRNFCERISSERRGKGNPMYGKKPWNKGNEMFAERMRQLKLGTKHSESAKIKQKDARKNHPLKARHISKHSEESKDKMRIATAARHANKAFAHTKTGIHIKVKDFLTDLSLSESFTEEFFLKYYSLDFGFEKAKVAIECQGSFFHSDPRFYPNGPISAIQRRNWGRDKSKKKYLESKGWKLIELWEKEINNGDFKKILLCELRKLNLINQLEQSQQ